MPSTLSAPIVRLTIADFLSEKAMKCAGEVLKYWVRVDRENCMLRQMGVMRLRVPTQYRVNEMPDDDIVELGITRPPAQQLERLTATAMEVADCLGHQLLSGDRQTAAYAALFARRLRSERTTKSASPFESDISMQLNEFVRSPPAGYVYQGLDELTAQSIAVGTIAGRFVRGMASKPSRPKAGKTGTRMAPAKAEKQKG